MLRAYVLYRLPGQKQCCKIEQNSPEPLRFKSVTELDGVSGFVFAPFKVTDNCPMLVIKPDIVTGLDLDDIDDAPGQQLECNDHEGDKQTYYHDFCLFHDNLLNGHFRKIVLSRCSMRQGDRDVNADRLFKKACLLYPHLFLALVVTPFSGTWLMATPEILIEKNTEDNSWHTIALAGTKKAGDATPWDDKNREEQALVADYIRSCISRYAVNITEDGPYTKAAAMLRHLRTDFTFSLKNDADVLNLIEEMHPTPAVCGLPKHEALEFILNNESRPREYYSGFAGPLGLEGETRLYVTLRCMKIDGHSYNLYAGGGLLCDSTAENEWRETEIKMDTMIQCIAARKA